MENKEVLGDPVVSPLIINKKKFLVKFPTGIHPYRQQRTIFYNMLQGIEREENVLIESPTGTGIYFSNNHLDM